MFNHQVLTLQKANRRQISILKLLRRGEMFAYMHGQVLHRYNCERLANGLGLTEEFGPPHWPQGIWPGYDSQLGSVINGNNIFLMKIFYW